MTKYTGKKNRPYSSLVDENGRVCTGCNEYKLWECFWKQKGNKTGHYTRCVTCMSPRANELGRNRASDLRIGTLIAYGSVCNCCGEEDHRLLSVDHVNNDGAEHRRLENLRTSSEVYRWLKNRDYPDGFQILCMNCNWGKNMNNGVCPHKDDYPMTLPKKVN